MKNMTMVKLKDSQYANEILDTNDNVLYCEIEYRRDKSSFAGMAFRIIENNNVIVRECEEKVLQKINRYENLYLGCELDYIGSIKQTFLEEERNYGIEIFFLVYSDVRSSQIIFKDLIKKVDEEVERKWEISYGKDYM